MLTSLARKRRDGYLDLRTEIKSTPKMRMRKSNVKTCIKILR